MEMESCSFLTFLITNFLLTHILYPISYRRVRRIKISSENSHGFSTKRSILTTFIAIRGMHICKSNNEPMSTNDAIHSIPTLTNLLLTVAPLRKSLSLRWSCFFVHNNTSSLLQDCLSDNLAFLGPILYKLHFSASITKDLQASILYETGITTQKREGANSEPENLIVKTGRYRFPHIFLPSDWLAEITHVQLWATS
jgi:hypothetical protein